MPNVIQRYYSGEVSDEDLLEALDDAVDEWHEGESGVPLHEFLGMCRPEYALFVQDPQGFLEQINSQKNRRSFGYGDD